MNRKRLITKCSYPWGDFSPTHAINHYLGCAFNCSYCWARDIWWKRMGHYLSKAWGVPKGFQWDKPKIFSNIRELAFTEVERLSPDAKVLLCSTTDPYQPSEMQFCWTQFILSVLQDHDIETLILTKAGSLARRDFFILERMRCWFGVTLERAPLGLGGPYDVRAMNIRKAHEKAIKTFVSLEPWQPGVDAIGIVKALAPVVDHWIVGPLNYKGVDGGFYRENLGALVEFLHNNTPSYFIKPDLLAYLEA